MVGDHHTSKRIYVRLKTDLRDVYRSIERLNINAMAQRYEASETLLRLVGEGIVEMPVSGGFALHDIDIEVAGHCYALS